LQAANVGLDSGLGRLAGGVLLAWSVTRRTACGCSFVAVDQHTSGAMFLLPARWPFGAANARCLVLWRRRGTGMRGLGQNSED
jgi:hypothetical protein